MCALRLKRSQPKTMGHVQMLSRKRPLMRSGDHVGGGVVEVEEERGGYDLVGGGVVEVEEEREEPALEGGRGVVVEPKVVAGPVPHHLSHRVHVRAKVRCACERATWHTPKRVRAKVRCACFRSRGE